MKVAFFDIEANIVTYSIILQKQPQTKLVYNGSKQFQAVFLNYGDDAFIKVKLD